MMRKSSFLTILFAFLPGAGQMYLGATKKGIALMSSFFLIFFFGGSWGLDFLVYLLPVVWFYAFFDTLNLRMRAPEEIAALNMQFGKKAGALLQNNWGGLFQNRHALIGGVCIFFGCFLIFRRFIHPYLFSFLAAYPGISNLLSNLPNLFVALLIILLGIMLIRGKRPEKSKEDFIHYGGDKHE